MAYAAVVPLMQLLDEFLIQFSCRVVEIENSKAGEFVKVVNRVLENFNITKYFPAPYLARLKEELKGLAPATHEDLMEVARSGNAQPHRLSETGNILVKLDGINTRLEGFVDLPVFSSVIRNPSATLSQQHSLEFLNDLISSAAHKEFRKVITFFSQVAIGAISLYERVRILLKKLKESNHDRVVNPIKFAAEKASDSIEEFLTSNPFWFHPDTEVKNIFDLLKDIEQLLSHTLKEVSSIPTENDRANESPQRSQLGNQRKLPGQPGSSYRPQFGSQWKWPDKPETAGRSQLGSHWKWSEKPKSSRRSELGNQWKWTDKPESSGRSQLQNPPELPHKTNSSQKSVKQEDIVVGLDDYISKIIDELIRPPSGLTIVRIVGMGGIGKTTLAKQVFHHACVVHHCHCLAWVTLPISNLLYGLVLVLILHQVSCTVALNVTYELDASISELRKLQTLSIYGPWIPHPTLFLEYWKMPCLRHVNVTVPSSLSPQPLHDSQAPSNLQTLFTVTFSSCTKEVFFLTPHLKKLGVYEIKEEYENGDQSSECFKNLSSLTKLKILKCSFYKGNGYARSLSLDVIPISLKKLTLSGSCLSWDEMKFLARLPKLEFLKLKNHAFQGPKWVLTEEVFPCLKQLLIDNTDLVHWEAASTDHFPCLERLVLRSCKSLENIPCGIAELSVIELIELHYCSQSAEISARKYEEQYGGLKVVIRSDN